MKKNYTSSIVYGLALLLLIPFILPQKANSQTAPSDQTNSKIITVSAIVPISDEWSNSITEKSKAEVIKVKRAGQKTTFSLKILGLENKPMKNQIVHAHILSRNDEISTIEGTTNKDGLAEFEFTPLSAGRYEVIFTDDSFEYQIEIKDRISLDIAPEVF